MRNSRPLLTAVGVATLIALSGVALLLLIVRSFGMTIRENEFMVVVAVLLPVSVAVLTLRRMLKRSAHTQREVRSVAIAYAATCPIWLVVSLIVAGIPSSYIPGSFGRFFILFVDYLATALVMAGLSYATCAFVLWLMRRESELSPEESPQS